MLKRMVMHAILIASSYQSPSKGDGMGDTILNDIFQSEMTKNSTRAKRSDYCVTETGERGECMQYYLCDGGVARTDGSGVIDLRMGGEEVSCSYLNVCCLPPNMRDADDPITPGITQRRGCGWRNPNGLGFRITGQRDHEAEFGEFPWMVAVLRLSPINTHQTAAMYVGGGSLIHPGVVLTAAHILTGVTSLKVRAGEWDSRTDGEQYPHQDRDVAEVEAHEGFNNANLFYDAALLFLSQPFDLAPNVGLACLPVPGEHLNPNAECFATGWGKDKFGKEGQYQNILKKIDLHLVQHESCEVLLRRTRLQKYFQLHSSFLCAGGAPGHDTCTGDGGSPLVCPVQFERDRYKQVGIVAWGIQCGHADVPGVYADVAALSGWIDRSLEGRGLDTSLYRY